MRSSASSSSENGLCNLANWSGETERVGGEANSSKLRVCGMGEGVDSAVEAGLGGNGGIARLGGEEPEVAHVLEFEDPESVEENKLPILVRGA
jgi:hypothetical protein